MTWTKIPPPAHHKTNNNIGDSPLTKLRRCTYLVLVLLYFLYSSVSLSTMHILTFTNQLLVVYSWIESLARMHLVSEPREPSISV